jgi:transposase InsO family protein
MFRTPRPPGERCHFALLRRCAASHSARRPPRTRRGPLAQQSRRDLEVQVRVRAVELGHWAHDRGLFWTEVAVRIGLAPRTLSAWRNRWSRDRLQPRPRGRRWTRSSRDERNAVVHFINDRGPCVGLPTLRAHFPAVRRCELADRLAHYRTVCRRLSRTTMSRLTWLRVGAVWAMDFVKAPELIDGRFPFLLSIEDLASRYTLLWSGVWNEDAATVLAHLAELFREHGAPLVLKSDNGSAFLAEALKAFLTHWLVAPLYSPPARPQYNGACERNNGCLKSQTHHAAALSAHADWWSSEDTAAAQATLNTTVRPWGHRGPTPAERWRSREPLSAEERSNFCTLLATNQREVRHEMNYPLDVVLDHYPQAAVDRIATQRALVTQGLLTVSRRSITLPLKQLKLAKIL